MEEVYLHTNYDHQDSHLESNASPDGYSRLTEVEAWSSSSGTGGSSTINWLVTDQLGTPRMIVDQTGSLSAIKRHDYLPFGEELFANQGSRTSALGYSADAIRQKFTQKERDNETGLDYFLARYYSSVQGRFTSVDPENAGGKPDDPQSWNGYAYARNNPLLYSDPDGRTYTVCDPNGKNCVEYSDTEFEKLKKGGGADGYTFKNGNIYYNGDLTATYSNDCLYCESLINGMAQRAPAMQNMILAFGAVNLAPAAGIVASMTLAGGGLTTLGTLSSTAATSASGGAAAVTALIQQTGRLEPLKNGVQMGTVRGNAQQIFNTLVQGGTKLASGAFRLADGTFVRLYNASSTGQPTIWIQRGAQQVKMRVIP